MPPAPEFSMRSFESAGWPLIADRLTFCGRRWHLMTSPSFEAADFAESGRGSPIPIPFIVPGRAARRFAALSPQSKSAFHATAGRDGDTCAAPQDRSLRLLRAHAAPLFDDIWNAPLTVDSLQVGN